MSSLRKWSVLLLAVLIIPIIEGAATGQERRGSKRSVAATPVPSNREVSRQGDSATRTRARVTETSVRLEVQKYSGEAEAWSESKVITSSERLKFRWLTRLPRVASATWVLTEQTPAQPGAVLTNKQGRPPGRSRQIAQGEVEIPTAGYARFEIDSSKVLPKWPPASPGVYHYWIYVRTFDAAKRRLGGSQPVKIDYRAPGPAVKIADACDKTSDCPPGFLCDGIGHQCVLGISYICEDEHFLVGTNGSYKDCAPYRCSVDHCLESCTSIDDCWDPNACFPDHTCGTL